MAHKHPTGSKILTILTRLIQVRIHVLHILIRAHMEAHMEIHLAKVAQEKIHTFTTTIMDHRIHLDHHS